MPQKNAKPIEGSLHPTKLPQVNKFLQQHGIKNIRLERGHGYFQFWGVPIDKDVRAGDVGAGTVTTESLGAPVETLTLKFAPAMGNATELVVEWEKTRVRIPIRRVSG